MVEITLGGKARQLEFTYLSLIFLEDHYDMSFSRIFKEIEYSRQSQQFVFYLALLKNEDESLTVEDVKTLIIQSVTNEETDIIELAEKLGKSIEQSSVIKKMVDKAKKVEERKNLQKAIAK